MTSEFVDLAACLPAELRDGASITRIGAGLSGAGVYRVEHGGAVYVLKITGRDTPRDLWETRAGVQQAAAAAGIAPRVLHVDRARRAIVTEHVVDRSLPARLGHPDTRADALRLLGDTLRRLHELPLPPAAPTSEPRDALARFWGELAGCSLPAFVGEAVQRMLDAPEPPRDRALVLSHNDVNPSNMAFDGERLLVLDWDTAASNDPLFDLATVAMFLRFDDATSAQLIAIHDRAPIAPLPERFGYLRRLIAAMCGCAIFRVARRLGHRGGTEPTIEAAPSLVDVYQRMRAGTLSPATPDGQWLFGLALIKAST